MSDFTTITSLNLGNTFGGWYAKTNQMIDRLNLLTVGSITGGDGIIVSKNASVGGYTLNIGSTITKDVTFTGNLTVNGVLNAAFATDVSGINVTVPYNSGVTVGNIVYITAAGNAEKAWANDACTSEVAGVVVGFTGSNAQVATVGKISGSGIVETFLGTVGATLQKGVVYFLSAGTSGAGTTAEPNTLNYISKPVLLGLTGDTGLILPFRGYKGSVSSGVCGSNTTTVATGICGGYVKSLNKTRIAPLQSSGDFATTGDLVALFGINYANSEYTKMVSIIPSDLLYYNTLVNEPSVPFLSDTDSYSYFTTFRNNTSTDALGIRTGNIQDLTNKNKAFDIFTTNGTTFDVWRLKNIKAYVKVPPERPISFTLKKQINRLSCTSYVKNENTFSYYGAPTPGIHFEIGSKHVTVGGSIATNDTYKQGDTNNFIGTPITGHTFLIAKEITPYYLPQGLGIDGFTTASQPSSQGAVTPDASGTYPLIHGTEGFTGYSNPDDKYFQMSLGRRTYYWDVNPVILGSTNTSNHEIAVSKGIEASIKGIQLIMNTPSGGETMDTSLLGWNATWGGVSESLWLRIYDIPLGGYDGSVGYTRTVDPYSIKFYFEFVKFNPINQTELQNSIVIPIEIDRQIVGTSVQGTEIAYQ